MEFATERGSERIVIDGMMHLEVNGNTWEGLVDEVIEYYDCVGIDKGVVLTTWMPSRESNDRTLAAYQKYPDRTIPFGHVRPEDPDWESELERVSEPPWKGLKLHQGELCADGRDLRETTRTIIEKAVDSGIRLVKTHLVDYKIVDGLTREFADITWILPHMGCYGNWGDMKTYCELAKDRENVYLDTSAVMRYYVHFNEAVVWAGADKITFASDGFEFSPLVEKAKIETMRLTDSYRAPRLTDEQMNMILGGNMARLLEL